MEEFIPIAAIFMTFGLPMLWVWTKHREKMIEATASSTTEKAAQYASQVKELEDRVRVLERIVTDSGYDVATQVEALRDTHAVEGRASEAEKAVN